MAAAPFHKDYLTAMQESTSLGNAALRRLGLGECGAQRRCPAADQHHRAALQQPTTRHCEFAVFCPLHLCLPGWPLLTAGSVLVAAFHLRGIAACYFSLSTTTWSIQPVASSLAVRSAASDTLAHT